MKIIRHCRRILDLAESKVSYRLTGDVETEERRYCQAVANEAAQIGKAGDWPSLVALVLFLVAAGGSLGARDRPPFCNAP